MSGSNWPIIPWTLQKPRWRLLVNGTPLAGCESASVHSNNHYQPDTMNARLSLSADPGQKAVWSDAGPSVLVEVQACITADGASPSAPAWQSVFIGEVDRISIDPLNCSVDISGRDLSARLIDAKTKESFRNRTVTSIVQTLAGRHGLTADVDDFSTLAGQFYQMEHDKLTADSFSRETTEHDLLVYLAKHVGADYWVQGTTLHFRKAVTAEAATPLTLVWKPPSGSAVYPTALVEDLKLERSLTLAKDIKVVMRIWNAKGKSAQEIKYPPGAKATAQEYVLTPRVFASPAAALAYVEAQYADIVKHERLASFTMPGELQMDARSIVAISGTGTSFDQRYYVDTIEREFSVDSGIRQTVHVKNHTTQSETQVG
jgi:phage protein D